MILTISLTGCNNKDDDNDTLLTLCELPESQEKEIGNQIPKWVSDADYALSLNVMTSTDLDKFNDYARMTLNALMQQMAMFDTETVLLLGYNYNNTIGIIGNFGGSNVGTIWNNYYILDTDHVEHKEVDTKVIPIKEMTGGVVDAMEPLCTERTETITDKATSCLELKLLTIS